MDNILTDDGAKVLILALGASRKASGKETFTEEEAQKILDWAQKVRIEEATLNNVLKGMLFVDYSDECDDVIFTISPKGKKMVEEMIDPEMLLNMVSTSAKA